MCGAPCSSEAALCAHCGARLATVACPSCFGVNFIGAKFCSQCGAPLERPDAASAPPQPCPRCNVPMNAITLGASNLRECPTCQGLWVDTETLRQICADREKQAAVLGVAPAQPAAQVEERIRYLPCPVCRELMNRVNFANYSGVIIEVCSRHGAWFDRDELRRVVEFIRSGGLHQARAREIADLQEERRLRQSLSNVDRPSDHDYDYDLRHTGISTLADVLLNLFK